jgi:hypothetical protein
LVTPPGAAIVWYGRGVGEGDITLVISSLTTELLMIYRYTAGVTLVGSEIA